ncbi:MAG: NAD(P)H-dependent oxidoreductase [Deltaproteobacteria bacterium]|nr:MAG: NAD(P)H-dependent oxidoreductase [Deltaproteobacteria bacterium]
MARLLYIEASPRKERSSSIKVAKTFLSEYQRTHPNDVVETLDLWNTSIPEFDGPVIDSKYVILHGLEHTNEQKQAWKAVEDIIAQFTAADKYLFSLPMWNFGIPYKLKHYIDVIVQPGYTFSFSPETGYQGLMTGKPIAAIYASGGAYGNGTGMESFDLQKSYLKLILGFIGFGDIQTIAVEQTLSPPEVKDKLVEEAKEKAKALAANF